jgi:hypothetical protein
MSKNRVGSKLRNFCAILNTSRLAMANEVTSHQVVSVVAVYRQSAGMGLAFATNQ